MPLSVRVLGELNRSGSCLGYVYSPQVKTAAPGGYFVFPTPDATPCFSCDVPIAIHHHGLVFYSPIRPSSAAFLNALYSDGQIYLCYLHPKP
ncbi:unnamed protein product [Phytomonas sp. Hart1]|nr:unnamed protein product [Phytomonas sp. Hart1]|eukprot:CCW71271.1 unnamed protein product [Phytomonas sp. isolate Hart1]